MYRNNAQRWATVSEITTVIGVLLTAAGVILEEIDYFWMIALGFLLGGTSLICFFTFLKQARRLSGMFQNENLLAHWVLDKGEQLRKAEEEYRNRKSINRKRLLFVALLLVVIGGGLALFVFDSLEDAKLFLLTMFAALVLITVVAFVAPLMSYRKMKKSVPEIFIATDGAWAMGEFMQWKDPMTRLVEVGYGQKDGAAITITYKVWQRNGYRQDIFRIPIPAGQEHQALDIAQKIAAANGVEFCPSCDGLPTDHRAMPPSAGL